MPDGQELVFGDYWAHNTRCLKIEQIDRSFLFWASDPCFLLIRRWIHGLQIPTFSTAKLFSWFKDHRQKGRINRCSHSVFEEDTQNKLTLELV